VTSLKDIPYVEIARKCSCDIGKEVKPDQVQAFIAATWLRLPSATMIFDSFNTQEIEDIVMTILKELDGWNPKKSMT
jgi:hypothetical protein